MHDERRSSSPDEPDPAAMLIAAGKLMRAERLAPLTAATEVAFGVGDQMFLMLRDAVKAGRVNPPVQAAVEAVEAVRRLNRLVRWARIVEQLADDPQFTKAAWTYVPPLVDELKAEVVAAGVAIGETMRAAGPPTDGREPT